MTAKASWKEEKKASEGQPVGTFVGKGKVILDTYLITLSTSFS